MIGPENGLFTPDHVLGEFFPDHNQKKVTVDESLA